MEDQVLIPVAAARGGLRTWAACAVALLVVATDVVAQQAKKRPNDPTTCPYCHNDPALMKASGVVSHGGFPFGKTDTQRIDASLPSADIRWVESANLRIGFGLGSHKLKFEERKKVFAELTRLQASLPEVVAESTVLDPWLRTHLYVQRTTDIYQRFLEIMRATDVKFPEAGVPWQDTYMGDGPYLGMRDKYEILVLPNETMHVAFLAEHCGLRVKYAHRWHYVDRGVMAAMLHAEDGQVRIDEALHAHLGFNLAHNLYDGFKHYSYDTPAWLHEGLAHFMEREISPNYNSFDTGEGAFANITTKTNWRAEMLKVLAAGEAPRMAELTSIKHFADLKVPHHFTTWSMVDYLVKTQPEGFAKFLWALKSNVDEKGVPTGANMAEWQRTKFKEYLGMGYGEFDQAWSAWCNVNYKPGVPGVADPRTK